MEIKHCVVFKELVNNPDVMINISRLKQYDNFGVTNITNSLFPFISWPSKKLFFKHPFMWHRRVRVGKFFATLSHDETKLRS